MAVRCEIDGDRSTVGATRGSEKSPFPALLSKLIKRSTGTFNPKVTGSIPVRPIREVPGNWLLARRTSDVLRGLPVRIQYG